MGVDRRLLDDLGLERRSQWGGGTWMFADQLLNLLFIFMAMAAATVIQPKNVLDQAAHSPGQLVVELRWPIEAIDDVDLYGQAPGGEVCWFNHKTCSGLSLLRDDRARTDDGGGDKDSRNDEMMQGNVLRGGEYVFNANLYKAYTLPVEVNLTVSILQGNVMTKIVDVKKTLNFEKQEVTMARFRLDKDGNLVPGSINDLPKKLMSAAEGAGSSTTSEVHGGYHEGGAHQPATQPAAPVTPPH